MPLQANDPRVRINKCSYVVYEHADLRKAEQFLLDFGMTIAERRSKDQIFFKGYGPDPFVYLAVQPSTQEKSRFGGAAYLVEGREELEKAVARIPNASSIKALDAPGGGEIVTLRDPAGHPVHLVHGQRPNLTEELNLPKLVVNYEDEKPRKGQFQRFKPGPAPVGPNHCCRRIAPDILVLTGSQMGALWCNVPARYLSADVRLVHILPIPRTIRHRFQPIHQRTHDMLLPHRPWRDIHRPSRLLLQTRKAR